MKYTFPLKKTVGWTALTSLEDYAAASWRLAMFYLLSTSSLSGVEKISRVHSTGKSLDRLSTTIWAGVGQVNWAHDLHRLLTSGWKFNSKNWMSNAETCKYSVQNWMSEAKTLRTNAKCWMRKNECTFHWTWKLIIQKLDCCLWKSWMSKAKTWMLNKSKLNVESKRVELWVQTEMTNTKCRTDCAKYNVKWNIEFWRKWNSINVWFLSFLKNVTPS